MIVSTTKTSDTLVKYITTLTNLIQIIYKNLIVYLNSSIKAIDDTDTSICQI